MDPNNTLQWETTTSAGGKLFLAYDDQGKGYRVSLTMADPLYMGLALTDTNPGTLLAADTGKWYECDENGDYTYFGNVSAIRFDVFRWNGTSWDYRPYGAGVTASGLRVVTATGNGGQVTFAVAGLEDTDDLVVLVEGSDTDDYTRTPGGGQVVFDLAPYNKMRIKFLF